MAAIYHCKEYVPATGETRSYLYSCEVLEPVGRYYYRIKITGAMYKGKPNAIVCVRRHNVKGYIQQKDIKINLPYKD